MFLANIGHCSPFVYKGAPVEAGLYRITTDPVHAAGPSRLAANTKCITLTAGGSILGWATAH